MNSTIVRRRSMLASLVALVASLAIALVVSVAPAQADAKTYSTKALPREGATFVIGGNSYKVTDEWEGVRDPGEVVLVKYGATNTKPVINTVKYQGKTYEVEKIAKNAFNNAKGHKIVQVTLGRNVEYIGAKAFYGCKKLKVINIAKSEVVDIDYSKRKGYYLDDVEIGAQAFKNAGTKNVKVKCGNNNVQYKKLVKKALVAKGLRSSAVLCA